MSTYSKPWADEIKIVAKAFHISAKIYNAIISATDTASTANMPRYYGGDKNAYLYDKAYKKLKPFIMASITEV